MTSDMSPLMHLFAANEERSAVLIDELIAAVAVDVCDFTAVNVERHPLLIDVWRPVGHDASPSQRETSSDDITLTHRDELVSEEHLTVALSCSSSRRTAAETAAEAQQPRSGLLSITDHLQKNNTFSII